MDSIWEVMNWVVVLRIQGPNKSSAKNMKRGPVKGRSHDAQLQILLHLPQELASFCLLFMICSVSHWTCPWLFLIGLHKSSILYSRRARDFPFQLSVGLALSYSVKPPQPGSLVGPGRLLKIWLLSKCHLWSLQIVYGKSDWWGNSSYSHTYLSCDSQTN